MEKLLARDASAKRLDGQYCNGSQGRHLKGMYLTFSHLFVSVQSISQLGAAQTKCLNQSVLLNLCIADKMGFLIPARMP